MVLLAFGKGETLQDDEYEKYVNFIYDAEDVPISYQFPNGRGLNGNSLTNFLNGLNKVVNLKELEGKNIPLCRIMGTESSELYNPDILLEEKVLFL